MTVQIVCNVIMFLSFTANIIFMAIALIRLPKGLRTLGERCEKLSEKEIFKLHQKEFTGKFFKLLIMNVSFLLAGTATCLLDGLSDTENGLMLPVWTFLTVSYSSIVFFAIYSGVLRKKYKIVESYSGDPPWNKGYCAAAQTGICALISFVFAFNSALTAYTAGLLAA